MKCIYLVDTIWMGHIPTYHQLFTKHLLGMGYNVFSLSPKPEQMKEWVKTHSPQYQNNFRASLLTQESLVGTPTTSKLYYKSGIEPHRRCLLWWKNMQETIEAAEKKNQWQVEAVFFPGIEINIISSFVTANQVDELFHYKWLGLFMTPKYMRKSFFKYQHKRLLRKDRFFNSKNCLAVATLDEGVVERMQDVFPRKKILVLPDITDTELPKETPPLIRKFKDFKKNRKAVGLLGEISKRKGIVTLLKAAQAQIPDSVFLFAGTMNEKNNSPKELAELQTLIKKSGEHCFFHLERVPTDAEFNGLFNECDIIYAAYENFYHSSNTLTKAAYFKKPLIVSEGYYMAEQVKKFNLGETIQQNNVDDCAQAIRTLINSSEKRVFEAYYQKNSPEKLVEFFRLALS